MCACWTLHSFSNLWIRLYTSTFIFCFTLIFTQYLLFITITADKSALQKCGIIVRNVVHSNSETENYLSSSNWWYLTNVNYHCDSLQNVKYPWYFHMIITISWGNLVQFGNCEIRPSHKILLTGLWQRFQNM